MDRPLPTLMDLEALTDAAECLKTLAHPHRLRMIQMLLQGEYTVGELAEACGIQSHMASEHLRLMRDRALLASERRGRRIYHRIAEPGLSALMGCIEGRYGNCTGGEPGGDQGSGPGGDLESGPGGNADAG